jgi:signal transduction histidine kinase/CheY-like chemotaxis protein
MESPVDARLIVETLAIPILVLDPYDNVVAANTSGIAAFCDDSRPVDKNFKDVVAGRLRGPLARAIGEVRRDRRRHGIAAIDAPPADGEARANVEVQPLLRDDGSLAGVLIVDRAHSDDGRLLSAALRTANDELQAANDELASRLEEVRRARQLDDERNRFLAMLAHELRNSLTGITNALHLLRRRRVTTGDRMADQALRIAERQARSQARLVDDLLDVSRIVLGKITLRVEPTDIVAVVRQAIDTAQFEVRSRAHALTTELPNEPITVLGDPVRLEQIVANLLSNAVKYTSPGGSIGVTFAATAETVSVTVSDTGVGMDAALLEHVFDLFTQGDATRSRAAGGLGIGLTVVKQLVELHAGTIEARSRGKGYGSAFEVRLPRTDRPPAIAPEAKPPLPARSHRILVVDDNHDARELLRTILELDGHEVQDTGDAATAVRLAVEWTPDVALIDIGLPDIDGYEVARRIRKRLGGIVRLIALTGYSDAEARRLAAEAGFDQHLVKPADPDRLSELLGGA